MQLLNCTVHLLLEFTFIIYKYKNKIFPCKKYIVVLYLYGKENLDYIVLKNVAIAQQDRAAAS